MVLAGLVEAGDRDAVVGGGDDRRIDEPQDDLVAVGGYADSFFCPDQGDNHLRADMGLAGTRGALDGKHTLQQGSNPHRRIRCRIPRADAAARRPGQAVGATADPAPAWPAARRANHG